MKSVIRIGLSLSLLLPLAAYAAGTQATLKRVLTVDPSTVKAVDSQATLAQLHDPKLIQAQSFVVLQAGMQIGTVMSGIGSVSTGSGMTNSVCFIAWQSAGSSTPVIVPTVGSGDWEAESCQSVAAVGLLGASHGALYIGFIYVAEAPHTDAKEPVILSLDPNGHMLQIDAAATKRASDAGATTVQAMRQVIASLL